MTPVGVRVRRRLRAQRRHRRRKQARLLVAILGLLLLAPTAWAQPTPEPPATVQVLAGGGASLSDESAAIPGARIVSDSPLYIGPSGSAIGRLRVTLALSGLPGESLDVREPTTWKSAEVYGELQRRIGAHDGGSTYLIARAGFLTRILPSDQTPRDRFARVFGAGLRAERRDADHSISRSISVVLGRSEVAAPTFHHGQLVIEGQVRVAQKGRAALVIAADAHLNLGKDAARGARDVMRASVLATVEL